MESFEKRKRRLKSILLLLNKNYPSACCALNFKNPLELLVATQLSAQCTDKRVNLVTKSLFENIRQQRIMQKLLSKSWKKLFGQLVF